MQLPLKQRNLYEETSPSFCAGRKFDEVEQALLWRLLQQEPQCPSRVLLAKAAAQRAEVYPPVACGAGVVQVTLHLSCVGVHLFARWLDQEASFLLIAWTCRARY